MKHFLILLTSYQYFLEEKIDKKAGGTKQILKCFVIIKKN